MVPVSERIEPFLLHTEQTTMSASGCNSLIETSLFGVIRERAQIRVGPDDR